MASIKIRLKITNLNNAYPKNKPFNDWLLQHYQSIKTDYALDRNQNTEFQKFLKLQDFRMTACLATCSKD